MDIRETPEGVLAISAEKAPATAEHATVHREIPRGRYERSFRLSRDLSREGVTADYRQGVLTIFVLVAEHTKPRRIEVDTNWKEGTMVLIPQRTEGGLGTLQRQRASTCP